MNRFTFRELNLGEQISNCGAMLPNKMQCYKPGKHVVLTDAKAKEGKFKEYQVCQMHMRVLSTVQTTIQTENKEKKEVEEKKNEQSNGPKS